MFKNAFLSEFSLSSEEDVGSILKSHLLSNERIVIPAATVNKTELGQVLASNVQMLGEGVINIAHGSDCNNLGSYIDKYENEQWNPEIVDLFKHFDSNNLCSVYETKNTISQFNKVMRECASGENKRFSSIFDNKNLCKSINDCTELFDLNSYLSIIDRTVNDTKKSQILKAHAKYHYNFFGSFSTDAGNTFSLENTVGFDYISKGYTDSNEKLAGINILISSALDLTDGIQDFDYLSSLDSNFLKKLSYEDVLDLRENWLHQSVIDRYEEIVNECAKSYLDMNNGNINSAVSHIEKAFELRQVIIESVKAKLKTEVNAYKIHRFTRFLADTSVPFLSSLAGVDYFKTIAQGLLSATTEVAVLFNREKQLKKLTESKILKIRDVSLKAETVVGGKSPALEYLRLVASRLS